MPCAKSKFLQPLFYNFYTTCSLLTEKEAQELQDYLLNKYKNSGDENVVALDRLEFVKNCCYACKRIVSSKSGSSLMNILDEIQIEGFVPPEQVAVVAQQQNEQVKKEEFPAHVFDQVLQVKKKLLTRNEMKEQIKDFLLDE